MYLNLKEKCLFVHEHLEKLSVYFYISSLEGRLLHRYPSCNLFSTMFCLNLYCKLLACATLDRVFQSSVATTIIALISNLPVGGELHDEIVDHPSLSRKLVGIQISQRGQLQEPWVISNYRFWDLKPGEPPLSIIDFEFMAIEMLLMDLPSGRCGGSLLKWSMTIGVR